MIDHYYYVDVKTYNYGDYVVEYGSILFWEGIYAIVFEFIPSFALFILIIVILRMMTNL